MVLGHTSPGKKKKEDYKSENNKSRFEAERERESACHQNLAITTVGREGKGGSTSEQVKGETKCEGLAPRTTKKLNANGGWEGREKAKMIGREKSQCSPPSSREECDVAKNHKVCHLPTLNSLRLHPIS